MVRAAVNQSRNRQDSPIKHPNSPPAGIKKRSKKMEQFKKGDLVYYRKRCDKTFDTIPCEVLQVGIKNILLSDGEKTYRASKKLCELQTKE